MLLFLFVSLSFVLSLRNVPKKYLTEKAIKSPKLSLRTCLSDTHTNKRLAISELNLYLTRYKTQKLQKSFKYQRAKIWNSVPYEFKKLPFDQLKLKNKKYLSLIQMIHNSKLIEID